MYATKITKPRELYTVEISEILPFCTQWKDHGCYLLGVSGRGTGLGPEYAIATVCGVVKLAPSFCNLKRLEKQEINQRYLEARPRLLIVRTVSFSQEVVTKQFLCYSKHHLYHRSKQSRRKRAFHFSKKFQLTIFARRVTVSSGLSERQKKTKKTVLGFLVGSFDSFQVLKVKRSSKKNGSSEFFLKIWTFFSDLFP